jgi:hypothetical protein
VIAVGDEEFQRRCFDYIYKLRRKGVTIVMVSHGTPLMEQMCDEVAWLDHGVLMAKGDPSEVVRHYLDKVNVAENERLSVTGEDPLLTAADEAAAAAETSVRRAGSREIEIDGFELLDGAGNPLSAGSTGDPLTIRVRYRANEPVAEPVFGLGFTTESGVRVAGPNTRFAGIATGRVEGEGHVDFVMDSLQLMPGTWRLTVAIVDDRMMHTYDHFDDAYEFHVQPGTSAERYGVVDLRARWVVDK